MDPSEAELMNLIFHRPIHQQKEGLRTDRQIISQLYPDFAEEIMQKQLKAIGMAEEGEYEAAAEVLLPLIALYPKSVGIYTNLGQIYQLAEQHEKAKEILLLGVERSEEEESVPLRSLYCQLGNLYMYSKEEEEARRYWEKAKAMGSSYAAEKLVEFNPVAQLCNQIVGQLLHKP